MIGNDKYYKEYKLGNGLIVALQNTLTQTVAANLRVNYGSSHEKEGEEGLAHFLEHCLITGGSEKYDPLTADEIRGSFGDSNAIASIGRTFFISQMLSEDLETWMGYLSDHVFKPRFDPSRVDGERERVLREISDAKSDPAYPAKLEFNKIFYRGHPNGKFVLGKEEVVRNANIDTIKNFHKRGYHPNNTDLIIVGGLPENIEELINNYFGSFPTGGNTRREFPKLNPLAEKIILRRPAPELLNADNPEESSAQIFYIFLGPVNGHEDEYTVRTMARLLGNRDANSLFFKNISLEKGLAYSIEMLVNGDYNAGRLEIRAMVPARRIEEAVSAIFEEMQKMKTQKVCDKSVERVKRAAKYTAAKATESNEGCASLIEHKLDEGLTLESFIKECDKVTPEKIIEVANKYLPDRENGNYVLYIRDPLTKL